MRGAPLLPLLLLASAGGCDALGGGGYGGGGNDNTFAVESRTPQGLGVSVSANVVVRFNVDIDPTSVELGVVTLNGSQNGTLQVDGDELTFFPPGPLAPGTTYAVALSPNLRGENGHLLGNYAAWGFKTAGTADTSSHPPLGPRPGDGGRRPR